ncbi:MAG TPA: hypothetical protein VGJ11_04385 [Gaiellales bacterium]
MHVSPHPFARWERWGWMAGIVFVLALLAESVVATGIGLTHQESAATIARGLHAHEQRMIAIACISIVYAVAFVVYLWKLYVLLRGDPARPNDLGILVLVGGVLFVTLHAVSDIGLTGMLGARAAGLSILRTGDLPRRVGWVAVATAPFLLLQGFGLGGVIATFGLALDLVGFVLLLVFVAWTSVAGYRVAGRSPTSSR